jgi:hypothetical protein
MSTEEIFGTYDTLGEGYVYRPNMLSDAKWTINAVKDAVCESRCRADGAEEWSANYRLCWLSAVERKGALLREKSAALKTLKQTTIGYARALKTIAESDWSTIHGKWELEPNEPEVQELLDHGVPSDFIERAVVEKVEGGEINAGSEKEKHDEKDENDVQAEKAEDMRNSEQDEKSEDIGKADNVEE